MDGLASTAAAIGDPVRREILDTLRRGPRTAGAIASSFSISRPAVSRHLRVLRDHGLVVDEARGRERLYRVDPAPLTDLASWLARFRTDPPSFEPVLDALATEVHRTKRDRKRSATTVTEQEERTA